LEKTLIENGSTPAFPAIPADTSGEISLLLVSAADTIEPRPAVTPNVPRTDFVIKFLLDDSIFYSELLSQFLITVG
jgi:hypothetical protein